MKNAINIMNTHLKTGVIRVNFLAPTSSPVLAAWWALHHYLLLLLNTQLLIDNTERKNIYIYT